MKPKLENVNILLADSDPQISRIVVSNLNEMGFKRVHYVRDATEALAHITAHPVDILITEWLLKPMDGIELVRHLRLSPNSPNRSIPIIMLTGKGEYVDVTTARDVGITEFLVKPFTVQTLFERLEHLVDHPRPFILAENFVGPDRRRRSATASNERRITRPQTGRKYGKHLPPPDKTPQIFAAEHEIKRTIGLIGPLATVITPEMLEAAQKVIENMEDETLEWVRQDLTELEAAYKDILREPDVQKLETMKSAALSVKARAGTFGFQIPSQIARMLYLFLSMDYVLTKKMHNDVVHQFIESLKVIFATDIKGKSGVANDLVKELDALVKRTTRG